MSIYDARTRLSIHYRYSIYLLMYLIIAEIISCFLVYCGHLNGELIGLYIMILPSSSIVIIKFLNKCEKLIIFDYIIFAYFTIFNMCIIAHFIMIYNGVDNQKLLNLGSIASIAVLVDSFIHSNDENYKLDVFRNLAKGVRYLFAILFLNIILIILFRFDYSSTLKIVVISFFSIASANIFFLGEEYCWRGYLQGMLQQKFGKRKGILLLSFIWETWHIPLWYTYYKVDFIGNIVRYLAVLGLTIVLGYIYMKTRNLWICALVHLMNNSISGAIGSVEVNKETLFITSKLGYLIIILSFVFIIIFSMKEYRDT